MKQLRGVNLGGWLVLERWMTPSLFEGTDAGDEYTFMQTPGAREKLREHQKNFIREDDFRWLAKRGVNAVRIPVGYWIFEGDSPYASGIGRLDWAFRMAEKYQLAVVVCLHGAPGSQNGRDHSGRVGEAKWFKDPAYREQTIVVLEQLAKRYRDSEAFWGLELLNEPPLGLFQLTLRRFYRQAYRRLIAVTRPTTRIIFSDAFTPRLMSGAIVPAADHPVVMDIHWYHSVNPFVQIVPLQWYFRWIIPRRHQLLQTLERTQRIIVGEWSGVIAGKTLEKYPVSQQEALVKENIRRQLAVYADAQGWFYWSYKTEEPDVWNFRSMVERGIMPQYKE